MFLCIPCIYRNLSQAVNRAVYQNLISFPNLFQVNVNTYPPFQSLIFPRCSLALHDWNVSSCSLKWWKIVATNEKHFAIVNEIVKPTLKSVRFGVPFILQALVGLSSSSEQKYYRLSVSWPCAGMLYKTYTYIHKSSIYCLSHLLPLKPFRP